MRLTITVDCDSAELAELDLSEDRWDGVVAMLERTDAPSFDGSPRTLRDINGNTVGTAVYAYDEGE